MATSLDALFSNDKIELIDEARQNSQLLAVTSELKVVYSPEGHGDSFWSVALGVSNKGVEIWGMIF